MRRKRLWWRRLYHRIVRLDGSPERIAGGVALGVILGVSPTIGIGMPIAAGLAALLHLNVAAALIGGLVGLPPFVPITWGMSCYLGGLILDVDWEIVYRSVRAGRVWDVGGDLLFAYLAGNIVLTALLTTVAFLVTLRVVRDSRRGP